MTAALQTGDRSSNGKPDANVRDLVVVGGSAGGIEALRELLGALPPALPAAVLVVLHMPAQGSDALPRILDRSGPLPARRAVDGERIAPGRVYVAARDHHLLVHDRTVRLSRSAQQNRSRPAVDPLFRSAARWHGPRVAAVVLSGALDDGAAGVEVVRARGGVALVQSPDDALFHGMPRAALAAVRGDATIGSPAELAGHLASLVGRPVQPHAASPSLDLIRETDMAEHDNTGTEGFGRPVGLGCPECGGGMSVIEQDTTVHYMCHVGHSYSPQTLIAAQREKRESALWTAVSMLEEQATVHRHLAARTPHETPQGATSPHRDEQTAAAERALRTAEALRVQLHDDPDS